MQVSVYLDIPDSLSTKSTMEKSCNEYAYSELNCHEWDRAVSTQIWSIVMKVLQYEMRSFKPETLNVSGVNLDGTLEEDIST